MPVPSGKYRRSVYGGLPVTAAYSLSCCCTIYLTHPGELVTPGNLGEAAANWSSRLPWVPVRRVQRQVAVAASQVEHVSITVVSGQLGLKWALITVVTACLCTTAKIFCDNDIHNSTDAGWSRLRGVAKLTLKYRAELP